MITKGQERCLYVFPMAEFQRITEALRTAPVTAKAVRDYSRVFFASASDEVPDRQGRVTIPPRAARVRRAERDCVVIGANTRVEVWDAAAWETYLADPSRPSPSCGGGAARSALSRAVARAARSPPAPAGRPDAPSPAPGDRAGPAP